MTLQRDAVDAYQGWLAEQATEARGVLGDVLAPWSPDAAEVESVEGGESGRAVVFATDGLFLAVQTWADGRPAEVRVVEPAGDGIVGWARVDGSPQITSLVDLGRWLDALPVEEPGEVEAWVQPTGAHDAYPVGAVVTHDGKTWENTHSGANAWEPGVAGWTEVA